MKRLFMAQPRLWGASVGFLFFSALEFFALYIRQLVLTRFPNSPLGLTMGLFVMLGFVRAWIFGVIIGQRCGFAACEWISGRRKQAKSVLRVMGIYIIIFYAVFFLLPSASVILNVFSSSVPIDRKWYETLEWYFATSPLQAGILLWIVARVLPDESTKAVQVAENIHL